MNKKPTGGLKIITINRKASFNYFFKELYEAGIVLKGSEIKSVRLGKINITDSYAVDKKGEIFLVNSHIPIYKQASYSNHNPYSERKLLLNLHWQIVNLDSVVVAERPKLKPHIELIREKLADKLDLQLDAVGVKATTNEGLGPEGREEGISSQAVVLLFKA